MPNNGHEQDREQDRVQDRVQDKAGAGRAARYTGWDDLIEVDDMPEDSPPDPPPPNNRERAQSRGYRPAYEKATRRPAGERESSFNALAWLIEGATGVVEELRHSDLGLSEDFWVHAAAARREGLLAVRAVLDQMLEETEQQQAAERERQERQSRRGGINVDF